MRPGRRGAPEWEGSRGAVAVNFELPASSLGKYDGSSESRVESPSSPASPGGWPAMRLLGLVPAIPPGLTSKMR